MAAAKKKTAKSKAPASVKKAAPKKAVDLRPKAKPASAKPQAPAKAKAVAKPATAKATKPVAKPKAAAPATKATRSKLPEPKTRPAKPLQKPASAAKPARKAPAAPAIKPAGRPAPPAIDTALLHDMVAWAKAAGADAVDAIYVEGTQLAVSQRLGAREQLERSEGRDLGLRAFVGTRQAIVSSTDLEVGALKELAGRAVAMARAVPEDPVCGLAPAEMLARQWPDLDLDDGAEASVEELADWCARAEDAARAVPGVTNSEGASASWGRTRVALAASNGFAGDYSRGGYSLSCSVLAGDGTGMERDYDWTSGIYVDQLEAPEKIGRTAGEKAVRRLNPRRMKSTKAPVVYDQRVASSMLGHLAGAINGRAIARKTSFLLDKLGQRIFKPGIRIIDDPHRKRESGSRPFDGEGLPTRRWDIVDDGTLTTWVLDLASARQLDLKPTGHGSRGVSGPPGPSTSNLYLEAGSASVDELIADIDNGLYITELIGFGVNGVTGDYSRGAAGFWIENGKLAWPVSGMTVAGNLKDMFLNLTPANDLVFKGAVNAPTVRIDGMTIAGE
ncbi:TldD/PmbA family protein [Vineibacter terrae]|uniref:TldD/PmbA family protein n=1 Tax=Vineibacter terrae TaxID=2586908 RepID=UPI002E2EBD53|nr:TldD/PmbA family protein [Vineibacter terrae]HEX2886170.1 TldD/PmbA family protein [Vineibacter terrae]